MDRNGEMRILQGVKQKGSNGPSATAGFEAQGLAGWALCLLRGLRGHRDVKQRQLRLVETLAIGAKRQLMLVTCAGESFLVGGGVESVETIVRLRSDISNAPAKHLDEPCQ